MQEEKKLKKYIEKCIYIYFNFAQILHREVTVSRSCDRVTFFLLCAKYWILYAETEKKCFLTSFTCQVSCVMCQVLCVMCQVSDGRCLVSGVRCFLFLKKGKKKKKYYKSVELVGEGFVINRVTPSSSLYTNYLHGMDSMESTHYSPWQRQRLLYKPLLNQVLKIRVDFWTTGLVGWSTW